MRMNSPMSSTSYRPLKYVGFEVNWKTEVSQMGADGAMQACLPPPHSLQPDFSKIRRDPARQRRTKFTHVGIHFSSGIIKTHLHQFIILVRPWMRLHFNGNLRLCRQRHIQYFGSIHFEQWFLRNIKEDVGAWGLINASVDSCRRQHHDNYLREWVNSTTEPYS